MVRNKWLCAFLVFLISLCVVWVPQAGAASVDAAGLKQLFDKSGSPARWDFLKKAVDGYTIPWVETYVMRSYLIMYQATGDKSYIDAFVDHADSVLNRRDSVRKVTDHRGYSLPVWRNGDNEDNTYYIYADETGLIATPLAQFGALVKSDPNLAAYKNKANVYVQAAKDAINVLFMSELRNTEVSFSWIETDSLLYINRPINKNLAVGCAMLAIYEATGEKSYLEKGAKITNFFKQRLLINSSTNSYYWMYYPDDPLKRYNNTPEDTNHANVAALFIKLAYDNGIFNETDMRRFANTAAKVLVKKDGTIANRLDGSGTVAQQGMIGSWLYCEPWAPSLFDIVYNIDAKLQKNDEVVGLALLNYVFAQRNSPDEPPAPEPDPDPAPTPDPVVDNLIANADFSAGAAGWVNLDNAASVNTESGGNKYLTNTYNFSFYQDLAVKPGGTYELNAKTRKGTAVKGARIVFRFYQQDGSETFKTFTYQNSGSGWEAMPAMTVQVPSTAKATKIYLSALPGDSGNQHFDDLTLVPAGDTAPAPAQDTTAPVAAISAPAAGSVLKDKATLEAAASDNVGVTQITLAYATSAQGSRTTIGAEALSGGSQAQGTWRLTWDVSGLTNGTYYVWATAKDAAGNTSTSGPVTYEIKNVQDLIVNGNFSAGAAGWVNLDNAASVNTESGGNKYLTNTYNFSFYQDLAVKPGGTYELNAKTRKGTAVKGARIVFRFYQQDGSETFKTFTYQNSGSGWEAMPAMTVQVPSTAKATKIYLSALPGDSGKQHFDDITLKKVN